MAIDTTARPIPGLHRPDTYYVIRCTAATQAQRIPVTINLKRLRERRETWESNRRRRVAF